MAKKGNIPWNKGIKQWEGKKHPMLGKKHTKEIRKKISEIKKLNPIRYWLGKQRPDVSERYKIHPIGKKGEEHWNWNGGITPLNKKLRAHSKWKIWREAIFLRDNFTCQNKNCSYCQNKIGAMLHPHHIKPLSIYPELVFDINNGITYCAEFHINSKLLHKNIQKIRRVN